METDTEVGYCSRISKEFVASNKGAEESLARLSAVLIPVAEPCEKESGVLLMAGWGAESSLSMYERTSSFSSEPNEKLKGGGVITVGAPGDLEVCRRVSGERNEPNPWAS